MFAQLSKDVQALPLRNCVNDVFCDRNCSRGPKLEKDYVKLPDYQGREGGVFFRKMEASGSVSTVPIFCIVLPPSTKSLMSSSQFNAFPGISSLPPCERTGWATPPRFPGEKRKD